MDDVRQALGIVNETSESPDADNEYQLWYRRQQTGLISWSVSPHSHPYLLLGLNAIYNI